MTIDTRPRLALALDVDDLVDALRLARRLVPWFGIAKVGLELFTASGPDAVSSLAAEGYEVFLDLKMHDIPTTVGRAARVAGALGAGYLTVHTAGGEAMVAAAVDGARAGAASAGVAAPMVLGVTVLTSEVDAAPALLAQRCAVAVSARCGGVVCAATDLDVVRRSAPGLITVVPGVRPAGAGTDDQARIATPSAAVAGGADVLVVGRAVTAADDPQAAATSVAGEVAAALVGSGRGGGRDA
jgi:orotidine-5'-phosphate decarboxylase